MSTPVAAAAERVYASEHASVNQCGRCGEPLHGFGDWLAHMNDAHIWVES